jgi:hypothetical protein
MSTTDDIKQEVSLLLMEWANHAKGAGQSMILYISQRSEHVVQHLNNPNIGLIIAAERANMNLYLAEHAVEKEDEAITTASLILVTLLRVAATALVAKVEGM